MGSGISPQATSLSSETRGKHKPWPRLRNWLRLGALDQQVCKPVSLTTP